MLQETLLALINHLQQSVYLHDNVQQELGFLSYDSVQDGSQQLQDIQQLPFIADHTPYL